jgi:ABC-type glycerol-3-phosphate transport system permease component
MGGRRLSYSAALYLGAAVVVVFCGVPLLWMVYTALKPPGEILAYPPKVLGRYTFDNFTRLFLDTGFMIYLKNSLVVAGVTVAIDITVATVGAYSLTRFRYPGKQLMANLTLFTYMFAPIMIIIPVYVLLNALELTNSHLGLVVAYTSISLPFTLWLLRAFFASLPIELEQAAFIDGANRFQTVVQVVLPQALPGIIATSVFAFVVVWNDYLFARVLLNERSLMTMPVGLQDIYEATVVDWGLLMSGAVVVTLPALAFFLIVQRYLISGWGMGALKA